MHHLDALPKAGQAEPGAGGGQPAVRRGGRRGVPHADPDLRFVVADLDGDLGAGRVLAYVRQRLADNPVHRAADHGGGELRVALLGQFGGSADGGRLGDQFGQGRGRGRLVVLGCRAEDADQIA